MGHEVERASSVGLAAISNGQLLDGAEKLGFDVLLTIDKRMRFEQNMEGRTISAVLLDQRNSRVEFLLPLVPRLLEVLESIGPGEVQIIAES